MSGPLGPLENLSSLWLHKIYFFLKAKRFDFHAIYLPWDNLMLTVVFGKLKFSSFQSEHNQGGKNTTARVPGRARIGLRAHLKKYGCARGTSVVKKFFPPCIDLT